MKDFIFILIDNINRKEEEVVVPGFGDQMITALE